MVECVFLLTLIVAVAESHPFPGSFPLLSIGSFSPVPFQSFGTGFPSPVGAYPFGPGLSPVGPPASVTPLGPLGPRYPPPVGLYRPAVVRNTSSDTKTKNLSNGNVVGSQSPKIFILRGQQARGPPVTKSKSVSVSVSAPTGPVLTNDGLVAENVVNQTVSRTTRVSSQPVVPAVNTFPNPTLSRNTRVSSQPVVPAVNTFLNPTVSRTTRVSSQPVVPAVNTVLNPTVSRTTRVSSQPVVPAVNTFPNPPSLQTLLQTPEPSLSQQINALADRIELLQEQIDEIISARTESAAPTPLTRIPQTSVPVQSGAVTPTQALAQTVSSLQHALQANSPQEGLVNTASTLQSLTGAKTPIHGLVESASTLQGVANSQSPILGLLRTASTLQTLTNAATPLEGLANAANAIHRLAQPLGLGGLQIQSPLNVGFGSLERQIPLDFGLGSLQSQILFNSGLGRLTRQLPLNYGLGSLTRQLPLNYGLGSLTRQLPLNSGLESLQSLLGGTRAGIDILLEQLLQLLVSQAENMIPGVTGSQGQQLQQLLSLLNSLIGGQGGLGTMGQTNQVQNNLLLSQLLDIDLLPGMMSGAPSMNMQQSMQELFLNRLQGSRTMQPVSPNRNILTELQLLNSLQQQLRPTSPIAQILPHSLSHNRLTNIAPPLSRGTGVRGDTNTRVGRNVQSGIQNHDLSSLLQLISPGQQQQKQTVAPVSLLSQILSQNLGLSAIPQGQQSLIGALQSPATPQLNQFNSLGALQNGGGLPQQQLAFNQQQTLPQQSVQSIPLIQDLGPRGQLTNGQASLLKGLLGNLRTQGQLQTGGILQQLALRQQQFPQELPPNQGIGLTQAQAQQQTTSALPDFVAELIGTIGTQGGTQGAPQQVQSLDPHALGTQHRGPASWNPNVQILAF